MFETCIFTLKTSSGISSQQVQTNCRNVGKKSIFNNNINKNHHRYHNYHYL